MDGINILSRHPGASRGDERYCVCVNLNGECFHIMGQQEKTALITGITGQDGAELARFLLGRGYVVHGMRPYGPVDDLERVRDLVGRDGFHLHYGDLGDGGCVMRLLSVLRPDEIYNLGAQSHVGVGFDVPEQTANVNGLGVVRLLEGMRLVLPRARLYQASSSEMFGNAPAPQNEDTAFQPCSPYATAKLYAYWMVRTYRQAYGLFACNGILFNHESPARGAQFVTRKIAAAVAAMVQQRDAGPLLLGNLDARRDWGHAPDYVRGMWLMMQHDRPDDFVLATGQAKSVRDFADAAFAHAGIKLHWRGTGLAEQGVCARTGRVLVAVDPALFRPAEVKHLCGDASRARDVLGWVPEYGFADLVAAMVDAEMKEGADGLRACG